ncbi:MAG: methionine gamma-lyase family protein [Bacillota bacterium]|nr:methionine gamma-lyase family protein [Bacillota bacterium]
MTPSLADTLGSFLDLPAELVEATRRALARTEERRAQLAAVRAANQFRVLRAFQEVGVTDFHLHGTTGYGYGDPAREVIEAVYARAFGVERALVAPYLVSGTHAIAAALFGLLRPGDHLLYATGHPYDTLEQLIFGRDGLGSLAELGVECTVVPLTPDGRLDVPAIVETLKPATRVVAFQRSRGYRWEPSRTLASLGETIKAVKTAAPGVVAFVDNCYGEFVEEQEPPAVGADLIAGSLIKNPGGSLAPVGGYIAGRADLVARAAARATAPGIGGEVGPLLDLARPLLQGFFLAPHFVGEALCGAVVTAALGEELGLEVSPGSGEERADLVQAIKLGSREALLAFCRGIQHNCAVNSRLQPEPAAMPGYRDEVIMAGGGFVAGATLELSVDAPLRPPYIAYLQGGLFWEQAVLGTLEGLRNLLQKGLSAR